jgi:hypothetical protein
MLGVSKVRMLGALIIVASAALLLTMELLHCFPSVSRNLRATMLLNNRKMAAARDFDVITLTINITISEEEIPLLFNAYPEAASSFVQQSVENSDDHSEVEGGQLPPLIEDADDGPEFDEEGHIISDPVAIIDIPPVSNVDATKFKNYGSHYSNNANAVFGLYQQGSEENFAIFAASLKVTHVNFVSLYLSHFANILRSLTLRPRMLSSSSVLLSASVLWK